MCQMQMSVGNGFLCVRSMYCVYFVSYSLQRATDFVRNTIKIMKIKKKKENTFFCISHFEMKNNKNKIDESELIFMVTLFRKGNNKYKC